MIRSNKALLFSFTIHALIALFAVALYRQWPAKQGGETRFKIALSCLMEHAEAPQATCFCDMQGERPEEREAPHPKPVEAKKPVAETKTVPKPVAAEKPEILEPVKKAVVPAAAAIEAPNEAAEAPAATVPEPEAVAAEGKAEEAAETPMGVSAPPGEAETTKVFPAASAEERYLQEHIRQIALLLRENLYYPRIARKRGITGEVTVAFELLTNGEVRNVAVVAQAHPLLNRAAVMTIERLSGEFPKPDEPLTLQVPINYRLQ
jgi:protein TonB